MSITAEVQKAIAFSNLEELSFVNCDLSLLQVRHSKNRAFLKHYVFFKGGGNLIRAVHLLSHTLIALRLKIWKICQYGIWNGEIRNRDEWMRSYECYLCANNPPFYHHLKKAQLIANCLTSSLSLFLFLSVCLSCSLSSMKRSLSL